MAGRIKEECDGAIIGQAMRGILAKSVSKLGGIMNKLPSMVN